LNFSQWLSEIYFFGYRQWFFMASPLRRITFIGKPFCIFGFHDNEPYYFFRKLLTKEYCFFVEFKKLYMKVKAVKEHSCYEKINTRIIQWQNEVQ